MLTAKELERQLRRHGVAAGQPALRRNLALALRADLAEAQLAFLAAAAATSEGAQRAGAVLTTWLASGAWRERWAAEQLRRHAAELQAMPVERARGLAACRVLSDRVPVDQAAAELGLTSAQVLEAVVHKAVVRGISEVVVQQLLGLAPAPEPRAIPRPQPAPERTPPAAPASRPTPDQVRQLWAKHGRRAPSHAIEALTKEKPWTTTT